MPKSPQMATITCRKCGLHGHLEREAGRDAMSAFLDNDAFKELCKSPDADSAAGCPPLG